MRTLFSVALACAILLAGCAAPSETPMPSPEPSETWIASPTSAPAPDVATQPPSPPPTEPPPTATLEVLSLLSSPEAVRLRMLHSHKTWSAIFLEAKITVYPPEGSDTLARLTRLQAWVRQPAEALVLSGPRGAPPTSIFVSDGSHYVQADLATGMTSEGDIAPFDLEPFIAPEAFSDTINGYPLAGMIGFPAGDLIFPTGLAQRQGVYEVVDFDVLAGRRVLILDWTAPTGVIADRFRIDALTGVLLRQQNLGKTGGGETVQTDIIVTRIVYDPEIPAEVFRVQVPETLQYLDPPADG